MADKLHLATRRAVRPLNNTLGGLVRLTTIARTAAMTALFTLGLALPSAASPVILPGTVINPGTAEYDALRALFPGVFPIVTGQNGGSFVAFNLSSLSFNPTAVLLVDDGIPLANDASALAGSGIDVDMAGGMAVGGGLSYATSVNVFVPGQRISGTGSGAAEALDAFIAANNPPVTTAASGGTGGDGPLFGTGASTLGSSDGYIVTTMAGNLLAGGYLAIGSGGQLGLVFANGIDRNGNLAGTIYDFVYFDVGGAGDNGYVLFDDQPIAAVPEPGTWLLIGTGLAFLARRRLRAR